MAKRRALAIAPALIKSIVKAPAITRDLSACTQGVDASGGLPEDSIPGSPPAALDAAHSSQLADGLSAAGRTPAAALQSRRKRRAAESLPGSTPQRQRCSGDMLHPEQPCAASSEECLLRGDAAMAGHAEAPVPAASQPVAEGPPLVTPARLRGLFGTMDRLGGTPSAAAGTAANPLLLNLPSRRTHVSDTAQPAKPCSTPCVPKSAPLLFPCLIPFHCVVHPVDCVDVYLNAGVCVPGLHLLFGSLTGRYMQGRHPAGDKQPARPERPRCRSGHAGGQQAEQYCDAVPAPPAQGCLSQGRGPHLHAPPHVPSPPQHPSPGAHPLCPAAGGWTLQYTFLSAIILSARRHEKSFSAF